MSRRAADHHPGSVPVRQRNDLPSRARVVIVGAGCIGLGVAWELAKRGVTDVVVLDRKHLNFGATARNGGGVRAQWTTKANIDLARESVKRFEHLSQDLGHNLFWRQGGYLFLARKESQLEALRGSVSFQNAHGVPTKLLSASDAKSIVPDLDVEGAGVLGAAYNKKDATLFPWPLVWGYYEAIREQGVGVFPFTTVTGIETGTDGAIAAVQTSRGRIACDFVINCTGNWVNEIGRMVGVEVPIRPERHEILVTEPLKPFLKCMLVDMTTGLYASQSSRGEILGGASEKRHTVTMDWASTMPFLMRMASTLTQLVPRTRSVRVLRQWAGSYDMTPDAKPIVEAHEEVPGLVTAAGFSGHGVMIHPVVCEIVAQLVLGETPLMDPAFMSAKRFTPGAPKGDQETLVIG